MDSRIKKSPGLGEQAAIGGFYPQYRKAAAITLHYWSELEWISIADSSAGKVDDFQIATPNQLDAYQVKWSRNPTSVTLHALTRSRPNKPSIFRQLAEGWKNRSDKFPERRVAVHYTTNGSPSTSIAVAPGVPSSDHFEAFLEDSWFPIHLGETEMTETDHRWTLAWEMISLETELSGTELSNFVRSCYLEFDSDLVPPELPGRERQNWISFAIQLTEGLFRNTASPDRRERLSKADVAKICHTEKELTLQNPHEFKFNERIFQRQRDLEKQIGEALETFDAGYVCVCGAPGSGKSTLLTVLLRNRPEHVVRYYAYTPDSNTGGPVRGEARNFLHDVLKQFEDRGLYSGPSLPHDFDLEILRTRFGETLYHLNRLWRETGKKTVILVDGLDHIDREQNPEHSLLEILPCPGEVPEGILIVLGTQTSLVLPPRVQEHVEQHRIFETRPLPPSATRAIFHQALTGRSVRPGQLEQFVDLTAGHPLTVEMVAARLAVAKNTADIDLVLKETDRYEGDISQSYRSYFEKIREEESSEVLKLLSLVVRLREQTINIDWIRSWTSPEGFMNFRRKCFQFFHRDGTSWRIFHNSFRLFISRITAQAEPGKVDEVHDRNLHLEIAGYCRNAPHDTPLRWEEFYHLTKACDVNAIREFISLDRFSDQFVDGRSISAIFEDLRIARRAIRGSSDGPLLLRLALITDQFDRRQSHVQGESNGLFLAAVRSGQWIRIKSQVAENGRLLVGDVSALTLARELLKTNNYLEASTLFSLIDTKHLEGGGIASGFLHRQRELLARWGALALNFWPIDEVIEAVAAYQFREARLDGPGFKEGDEIDQAAQKAGTIAEMAVMLRLEGNSDEANEALHACEARRLTRLEFFSLRSSLARSQFQSGEVEKASRNVRKLLSKYDISDPSRRIDLAIFCGHLGMIEEGNNLLSSIPLQVLDCNAAQRYSQDRKNLLFARCKAAYCLGESKEPEELIPRVETNREALRFFALEEARIAYYSARALQNTFPSMDEFRNFVDSLFWRLSQDHFHWVRDNQITNLPGEIGYILSRLITVCGDAGRPALQIFCLRFDSSLKWIPTDIQRDVVIELSETGAEREWCSQHFIRLNSEIDPALDAGSRAHMFYRQAEGWMKLGDWERTEESLRASRRSTFGIGYDRDYQINSWVPILSKKWESTSCDVSEELKKLAQSVVSLNVNLSSSSMSEVGEQLLGAALKFLPSSTKTLWRYLEQNITLNYPGGLASIIEAGIEGQEVSSSVISNLFTELLLPIETEGIPSLIFKVLERSEATMERCEKLRHRVITSAPIRARNAWIRGIERYELSALGDRCADGGAFKHKPPVVQENSSFERVTEEASMKILRSARPLSAVRDIIAEESEKSRKTPNYYSNLQWPEIIDWISPRLEASDYVELLELFEGFSDYERILLTLAPALVASDNSKLVIERSLSAIERLREQSFSDRETCFAIRALLLADPVKGRIHIFDIYTEKKTLSPENWIYLLPHLLDSSSESEFFSMVDSHLEGLLGESNREAPPLDFPLDSDEGNRRELAILDLLWMHVEHETGVLRHGSQRAFANFLLEGNAIALRIVEGAILGTPVERAIAVFVLRSVASECSDEIDFLRRSCSLVQSSSEIDVVIQLMEIADIRGWNFMPENNTVVHSDHYNFKLPPVQEEFLAGELRFLHAMLAPFEKFFGVPLSSLLARAESLLREYDPRDSSSGSSSIRFSRIGLEFIHRKHHVPFSERVVFRIMTELVDLRKISFEHAACLVGFKTTRDRYFVTALPQSLPGWIDPCSENDGPAPYELAWLDAVYFRKTATETTERVLASRSCFRIPTDNLPEEVRILLVKNERFPIGPFKSAFDFPFVTSPSCRVEEYLNNAEIEFAPSLILAGGAYVDSAAGQWLSFNPNIAIELNWTPDPREPFMWMDSSGVWMVRSVWWQDGQPSCVSSHIKGISSRGWAVIASDEGIRKIESAFGKFTHHEWRQRSQMWRGEGARTGGIFSAST